MTERPNVFTNTNMFLDWMYDRIGILHAGMLVVLDISVLWCSPNLL